MGYIFSLSQRNFRSERCVVAAVAVEVGAGSGFLQRFATWGLAITMVVLSIVCAHVAPVSSEGTSVMEKTATETQTTNPNTTPGFGASQQQAAPAPAGAQQAPAQQAPAK